MILLMEKPGFFDSPPAFLRQQKPGFYGLKRNSFLISEPNFLKGAKTEFLQWPAL
jgi:hypothetical protein